MQYQKLFTFDR